jgi:hypothetical protein
MRRYVALLILSVGLARCTSFVTPQTAEVPRSLYPVAAFSHRVGSTNVLLYWNCVRPEPDLLRLDGVVQNAYASEVRYPVFDLVAVDAEDRVISAAQATTEVIILRANQISPFRVDLRTTRKELQIERAHV